MGGRLKQRPLIRLTGATGLQLLELCYGGRVPGGALCKQFLLLLAFVRRK